MFSDKKLAKDGFEIAIAFFILGIIFCILKEIKFLGFIIIFIDFIFLFINIIFYIRYLLKKKEISSFCKVHNYIFYENCNKIIDEIGFNKIYKLRKLIDFHEGISKETDGIIKKYIHGIVSDNKGFDYNYYYFFLLEFKNVYFPKFYLYTPYHLFKTNGLSTETDRINPVLTYECPHRKELKESSEEFFEKNKKLFPVDEYEKENIGIYLVNGKDAGLIKLFFNENIIKELEKLSTSNFDINFIEARENFLILTSPFSIDKGYAERCKLNEKLLPRIEKIVKLIDSDLFLKKCL